MSLDGVLYAVGRWDVTATTNYDGSYISIRLRSDAVCVHTFWDVPTTERWWRKRDRLERAVAAAVREANRRHAADETARTKIAEAQAVVVGLQEVERIVGELGGTQ